ncbi:hypothetical protein ACWGI8_37325 [Streptomyces sp. NPDC054841]
MGVVARRPVAVVAAIVLFLEAVGIVAINGILATFVDSQNMSLDGLDPDVMAMSTWVMGGVLGFYLAFCGVVLLVTGIRDRAPGRFGRILLIACAVLHGVLGALTVGLVGWHAFAFLMVVLGLVVLSIVLYAQPEAADAEKSAPADAGSPVPDGPATA